MAVQDLLDRANAKLRQMRDEARTPAQREAVEKAYQRARTDYQYLSELAGPGPGKFESGKFGFGADVGLGLMSAAPFLGMTGPIGAGLAGLGTAGATVLGGLRLGEGAQRIRAGDTSEGLQEAGWG